jgi:hypothetical protein
MAVVTDTRTLRNAPGGDRLTDALYGHKCSIVDQSPASPAAASWLQIRLDNDSNQPVGWISADAIDAAHDAVLGSLSKDSFADYCVLFEKAFLSSSLYLMAVAELRTGITVDPPPPNGGATVPRGAFALTAADWAYGLKIPGYPFNYKDGDIDNFVAQIDIFGAMAQSAQTKITSLRKETPSFVGLYLTQVLGAGVAKSMLDDPSQKVSTLLAAADATDLAKDGVDKASVLARYRALLGADGAATIIAALTSDMQKAIDTVQPLVAGAGGTVTSSADSRIASTGTIKPPPANLRSALKRNQWMAFQAALGEGLRDVAARALVANMTGESLAKPTDNHFDVSHMSQGIVQWDPSRSAKIQQQFGALPKDMSVADQTRAALWEIKTFKTYSPTKIAIQTGNTAEEIIRALVINYEDPADKETAIGQRIAFLQTLSGVVGQTAQA